VAEEGGDKRVGTFRPTSSQGLDIAKLIGAPLVAAATANSAMAREQYQFLMDFCFRRNDDGHYEPVMLDMFLNRSFLKPPEGGDEEPSFEVVTARFQLPLLTFIPISSLAVDKVKIDFEMEVTQAVSGSTSASEDKQGKEGATLQGKISYDSREQISRSSSAKREYSSKNNSSLKVSIDAGQLPLPPGLTAVLDLYTRSLNQVKD
jgi:hypothetical protein